MTVDFDAIAFIVNMMHFKVALVTTQIAPISEDFIKQEAIFR